MSTNQEASEKNPNNCIQCNYFKEAMQKFSCNHLICNECLCLLLIEQEFHYMNITSSITFHCPECRPNVKSIEQCPNLTLTYLELNDIFSKSNNAPLKCIKHPDQELKYFCESCNDELCEECKNIDVEHDTSQIELEDIKGDEAEKLLKTQCLSLEQIKNKIEENRLKINMEITQTLEENIEKINDIINELNNLKIEIGGEIIVKEKMMNDYFDMMVSTYDKYYSMINSNQISMKTLKFISNMKNILNINILQNNIFSEKLDSLNSFFLNQKKEIKNIFPLKLELIFKEGFIQTGNCTTFNTEHKQFMTGGILINNASNLVTASTDNTLIIYEKKPEKNNKITFNIIKKETDKKIIATSLFNLNKDYFVVGYDDGLIKVWRTEDCEVDKIFTGHTGQINKIIKEGDNSLISCSDDATIRGWQLDSLEADSSYTLTGHEDKINDILLLNDNVTLISVSDDKTMRIWSLENKECINAINTGDIQTCLGKLKNGKFMLGGEDGSITIFNVEGFEPINSIKAHDEPIEILYESPFTGDIISGSQDNLVKIFKVDNGTCVKILEGHKSTVLFVSQIDENTIVTSSVDKTVKIWSI